MQYESLYKKSGDQMYVYCIANKSIDILNSVYFRAFRG